MKMKARDLSAYVVADLTLFAFGFYALRIRKLGLYMFLMVIGAPASFAVLPVSEMVARQFGLHLGSAPARLLGGSNSGPHEYSACDRLGSSNREVSEALENGLTRVAASLPPKAVAGG